MGLRFQRRVRILPGVTLNFSRKGVSTSLGVRGARVTLGHGRRRTTVGLPGTGLSYTTVTKARRKVRSATPQDARATRRLRIWLAVLLAVIVLASLLFSHGA